MNNSQTIPKDKSERANLAKRITVDKAEITKFQAMAQEWWDPYGKFRPLHKLNPIRLTFIRDQICGHFDRNPLKDQPLTGLRLLDIGCGGGLLSEPMARLGAQVLGADASEKNIEAAKAHALKHRLDIDYRSTTIETLADGSFSFDVILNMEVVEHVTEVRTFLNYCVDLLKPDGLMVIGTINRTLKAYALAIVGAEMLLRWLPRGTHHFDKLVRPEEIEAALAGTDTKISDPVGLSYNPLADSWSLSKDISVNYMCVAVRLPN